MDAENTLNQLLTEMDGFQTQDNVIVLASTNRADVLDRGMEGERERGRALRHQNKANIIAIKTSRSVSSPPTAALRPGRFDRKVFMDVPDVQGREEHFKRLLGKFTLAKPVESLAPLMARMSPGYSGADIENVVNEAALRYDSKFLVESLNDLFVSFIVYQDVCLSMVFISLSFHLPSSSSSNDLTLPAFLPRFLPNTAEPPKIIAPA